MIPEINIGLVGHVDHGKTTLTAALTGKWTDTHSEEKKRGITIRLGYAEFTVYRCPKCSSPECYGTSDKCIKCFSQCRPVRTISLVDAPGHETLMATVLSGASLMDGALLTISANEPCPQPQTREHLMALEIVGIKNIVIVQNKIDLVSREEALKNYQQIKGLIRGTVAENAPIIPVSAQQMINIDALIEAMEKNIATPKRDASKSTRMLVARSFDVNRPGTPIKDLKGGVIGGSLTDGELKVGEEIEIRPGIKIKNRFEPVRTSIKGLQKAMLDLQSAGPGGLIGVSTGMDPYFTKSDNLAGSVVGLPERLPPVWHEMKLGVRLLERVVGAKEEVKLEPIKTSESLMFTVGTARTVGTVSSTSPGRIQTSLKIPVCADRGAKVAISRQIMGRWRLIGWGEIE